MPNFATIGQTAAAIWRFFQDGGRPPSWICDEGVWTTHEGHLVVFITVQNLVGIDAAVLIICMLFDFTSLAGDRLFMPRKLGFWGILRSKWGGMSTKPPKGTSFSRNTSYDV